MRFGSFMERSVEGDCTDDCEGGQSQDDHAPADVGERRLCAVEERFCHDCVSMRWVVDLQMNKVTAPLEVAAGAAAQML